MSISNKYPRRKPDLFTLLLLFVTLGLSVTVAYQVNLYHDGDAPPIARQTPPAQAVGG